MSEVDHSRQVAALVQFFEHLSPHSVQQLSQHYDAQARFKDPFNDVQGVAAIERIFTHMFQTLEQPRFVVTAQVLQGAQCFLTWEFHFGLKRWSRGQPQRILGATQWLLSDDGRVVLHRDYWDAAEELYEKLPLVGSLMRWLKRRARE